jgi:threonine synthase
MPRLVAGEAANRPGTVASAIRISEPAHAEAAQRAVEESGGSVVPVDDAAILEAWELLAREEGLFCEPSSAAGLAALLAEPPLDARVVCVITGHGLKDPDAVA